MGSQHVAAAETLMILASILAAEKNKCVSHDVREVILRAKAEIESRTDGSILIDELADSLGISGSHLRDVFKQHTGLTPYQYHLKLKISRAKALLRTGNSSIKQISDLLGFRSVFHFMKLFKGKTGMTASQWRSGSAKERSNRNNAPANDSY
jgi:AraC-like DNA-binding protein